MLHVHSSLRASLWVWRSLQSNDNALRGAGVFVVLECCSGFAALLLTRLVMRECGAQ